MYDCCTTINSTAQTSFLAGFCVVCSLLRNELGVTMGPIHVLLTKEVDNDCMQISTSARLTTVDVVCTQTAPIHRAASAVLAKKASMATDLTARVSSFCLH